MERSQEYFAALITVFRTTFASIYQSFAMPKGGLCAMCIESVSKKITDESMDRPSAIVLYYYRIVQDLLVSGVRGWKVLQQRTQNDLVLYNGLIGCYSNSQNISFLTDNLLA